MAGRYQNVIEPTVDSVSIERHTVNQVLSDANLNSSDLIRAEAEVDTVLRMTMLEMLQDQAIRDLVVAAAVCALLLNLDKLYIYLSLISISISISINNHTSGPLKPILVHKNNP